MEQGETTKVESAKAMLELAGDVAGKLVGGEVFLLEGELGSGKTTFTQGLAVALGVEDQVTSPTFTIVGEYEVLGNEKVKELVHVDLYRLDREMASQDTAVVDALEGMDRSGRVTVIEWADRLARGMVKRGWRMRFKYGKTEGERLVIM